MKYRLATALLALLFAVACDNPRSPRGFSLPAGDESLGQASFEKLGCPGCHEVIGVELALPEGFERTINVRLGGETEWVKTYGQLVTSIINPSHRLAAGYRKDEISTDGVSKMANYNDVMTVSELIDLVAFLEAHYELRPFERTDYPVLP